jgi:hypothetical protein
LNTQRYKKVIAILIKDSFFQDNRFLNQGIMSLSTPNRSLGASGGQRGGTKERRKTILVFMKIQNNIFYAVKKMYFCRKICSEYVYTRKKELD